MAKQTKTASLLQVLLWYDEPQIVLMRVDIHKYVVAVAIEREGMQCPFVGAEVSARQLLDYKIERIDLRYLYMRPDGRKWWLFDLQDGETVTMKQLKSDDVLVDANAPESGFFSRFHAEIKDVDLAASNGAEKFEIDGNWDLGEFSQFYGQLSDLYYMFHNAKQFERPDLSPERRRQLRDAFLRPFQGGGSYRALYKDFANDNDRAARLRVSGIQYNSPGYVEVKALEEPISDTIGLLGTYAEKSKTVKGLYESLHRVMSYAKLLRGDHKLVFPPGLRADIIRRSEVLANEMGGLSYDAYLNFAQNDVVVATKVLLSVCRRVDRLYQFFLEGRAKHSEVPVG